MGNPTRNEIVFEAINDIFESINVYQSVIIVERASIVEIVELLMDDDYPVACFTLEADREMFVNCRARMLIVCIEELDDLMSMYSDICWNVTLFISTTARLTDYNIGDIGLPEHVSFLHV